MNSVPKEFETAHDVIISRALKEGGFSAKPGGRFNPQATAWGILALRASGDDRTSIVRAARKRLADSQLADGRIPLANNVPIAFWPTGLAMLSWIGDDQFRGEIDKACQFLLSTTGLHFAAKKRQYRDHDSSIKGWPWIEGTYSWVIPSSIAILALRANALHDHERVQEGIRMIVDRQIPSGGWNFGDNFSFGKETLPFPEATGYALNAVKHSTEKESLTKSIDYLKAEIPKIRTPLSLSWALLGLGAWSERPAASEEWLLESLSLQKRYGPYDTDLVAHLVIALYAHNGLLGIFRTNTHAANDASRRQYVA